MRRLLNGLWSLNKTGGPWRLVPQACGHWSPIEGDCTRGRRDGVWARVMATLRQWERRDRGHHPEPAAGSLDSQRLKTAPPTEASGVDGTTQLKGRTRQILGDTLGVSMAGVGTSAATAARLGVVAWLSQSVAEGVKRRRTRGGDGADPAEWLEAWVRGVQQTPNMALEATTTTEGQGFPVIPWRGAVERTFAWRLKDRRHRRDDARLTAHSVALIQMSMIRLVLHRWA